MYICHYIKCIQHIVVIEYNTDHVCCVGTSIQHLELLFNAADIMITSEMTLCGGSF